MDIQYLFFATLVTENHNKDGIVIPKNYLKMNPKTLSMIEKIPLMLLWQTMMKNNKKA